MTALAVGGLSAIVLTTPKPADAVPGNPGTPSAGTTVYAEDFQNVPNATTVQTLTQYTGDTGQKYTANTAWLTFCNGLIASQSQSPTNASAVAACANQSNGANGQLNWNTAQQLSYALGVSAGQTPAQAQGNYADTAYTAASPGAGLVEFQTASNIPFTASNRFITFSVDAAAVNCATAAHPLLQFQLLNSGGTASNVGSQIDACSSTKTVAVPAFGAQNALTANVGTYTSNGAQLFSGSSIGVRMLNNQGTGAGNDHAIDNIKILDVTPQLDKSFSPATVPTGGISTLTFTVTNTSELAAKNGWSFTDELPAGLTIANPNAAATTCAAGQVTAAAGSDSVAVTGNLNAGQASCTVSVSVTSPTAGSFTNGPGNVTETGLNPPGDTTVTFVDPTIPTVLCTTDPVIFNTGYNQTTDGQAANGTADARWTVAGGIDGFNHSDTAISGPGTIALPPAGATFGPAYAGKVNNLWANSQSGQSQWISANYVAPTNGQNQTTGGGDWYYRYQFNLDPQVDPATFQLDMKWLADNTVAGVWVNNQPQSGANLPQNTTNPYQYAGFDAANAASTQMAGDFKTGLNTILVQVQSNYPAEGFDAEVTSTALCPDPTLTIAKTAENATSGDNSTPLKVGDEVNYTVTAKNTANVPFTADDPAKITDDMSDVVDDATLDESSLKATVGGQTVAAPMFDSPNLSWSGPLEAGQTVTLTYTVTYTGGGNSTLVNNACVPEGSQTTGTQRCASTELPAPDIRDWKTVEASSKPLAAGSTLTYTLHFENTGATTGPVDKVDDLSQVLDDATVTTEPTTATGPLSATRNGDTIAVTGNLPAGATSTITYTVTLKADGQRGDNIAANYLLDPGQNPPTKCVPTDEQRPDCTSNAIPELVVGKTVDPKSGSTVSAGQVLTYTLTFDNSKGAAAAPVTGYSDDLSKVLDDATVTTQPTTAMDSLTVGAIANGSFPVTGTVPAGKVGTVTYEVTVKANGQRGDDELDNSFIRPNGPPVETHNPVQSYSVTKTASTPNVHPGDTVTYTVTVTNTGKAAYTADEPASIEDDLSKVLDDATYVAGSATNGAEVSGTTLTWSGPLAVGAKETITYEVLAGPAGTGDGTLTNVVTPTGNGGGCDPEDSCTTSTPLQAYTVKKTSDATKVTPGEKVTYTITVTNTGKDAYTAADPATFTDDMSKVLDDATYNGDATNGATYAAPTLSWSGALAAGQTVTVTYSVTVNDPDTGDKILDNAVVTPPDGGCPTATSDNPDCRSVIPSGSYTVTKTADTKTVTPGGKVAYTVTVKNTGKADYTSEKPASFRDDLTNVLDDAEYNGDATQGAKVTGNTLTWAGPLKVGQTVKVTYSVTVKDPDTGNLNLVNAVAPTGDGGDCDPDGSCITHTPVKAFTVTKTVSTTDAVKPGTKVGYTVTVKNTGAVAFTAADPASFTDDMSNVLDDATYNSDATHGATLQGTTLTWSGPLEVGRTIEVTYSVTVKPVGSGNGRLINTVDPAVDGSCDPAGSCETGTPIRGGAVPPTPIIPGLAFTGTELVGPGIGLALLLLALGGGLLIVRRRRQDGDETDNA
ncbi:hypothetical protein [Curtobacterium sp. L1-20]|uniref:DUF7927 domain-containing protein n=1 Tax=Curtobacterium sp. L1-20 TaxID=3138181 RepID=UPI003B51C5F1